MLVRECSKKVNFGSDDAEAVRPNNSQRIFFLMIKYLPLKVAALRPSFFKSC